MTVDRGRVAPGFLFGGSMDFLLAVLGMMDDTIMALLEVPILSFFLGGSVILAIVGLFLLLKDAAGGRNRR